MVLNDGIDRVNGLVVNLPVHHLIDQPLIKNVRIVNRFQAKLLT